VVGWKGLAVHFCRQYCLPVDSQGESARKADAVAVSACELKHALGADSSLYIYTSDSEHLA
jgi:hypothetical protein